MNLFGISDWSGYEISPPAPLQQILRLPVEERLTPLVEYIESVGQFSGKILAFSRETKREIITFLFAALQEGSLPAANTLMRYFVTDLTGEQQISLVDLVESVMKNESMQWRMLFKSLIENISDWSGEAQYKINALLTPRTDRIGRQAVAALPKEAAQNLTSARVALFAKYVRTLLEEHSRIEKWPQAIEYLFTTLFREDPSISSTLLAHLDSLFDQIFFVMVTDILREPEVAINLPSPPRQSAPFSEKQIYFFLATYLKLKEENRITAQQIFDFFSLAQTTLHHPFLWVVHFSCFEMGFGIAKNQKLGKNILLEAARSQDVSAMVAIYLLRQNNSSTFSAEEISEVIQLYLSAAETELPHFPLALLAYEYESYTSLPEDQERLYQFFVNHPAKLFTLVRDGFHDQLFGLHLGETFGIGSYDKLFYFYLEEILQGLGEEEVPNLSKLLSGIVLEEEWQIRLAERFGEEKLAEWMEKK